jgi:uncharacterized protein YecE (DUF72 family)
MIRIGIGGWNFAPWRGRFYPKGLKQAEELSYASRHLTSIEINGTFYRSQTPASFAKWRDETPEDFVFAVKGHRAIVNAKKLAEASEPIDWFFKSGVLELGEKLGPLLWQLAPFKKFDREDLAGFLTLLPKSADGRALKHVIEVRHASFLVPDFVALLREHNAAAAYAESEDYPEVADITADFIYARLQKSQAEIETGYSAKALDGWAARAKLWETGGAPEDLPTIERKPAPKTKREVFLYFIAAAKENNPAAAMALIERLK